MSNVVGSVKVRMTGVTEVCQRFGEIGQKLARRSVRRALNAVGDMWVEEVQSRAPDLDGALKNSIVKKVSTRLDKATNEASGSVTVGPEIHAPRADGKKSVGPGIYAMFVEFGLKHKTYPKQPFMRPTFDATSERAEQLFADTLKDELEDVVNELT
jgi:HK97 gp10 family phage protein